MRMCHAIAVLIVAAVPACADGAWTVLDTGRPSIEDQSKDVNVAAGYDLGDLVPFASLEMERGLGFFDGDAERRIGLGVSRAVSPDWTLSGEVLMDDLNGIDRIRGFDDTAGIRLNARFRF
jgi:hypothetical protein